MAIHFCKTGKHAKGNCIKFFWVINTGHNILHQLSQLQGNLINIMSGSYWIKTRVNPLSILFGTNFLDCIVVRGEHEPGQRKFHAKYFLHSYIYQHPYLWYSDHYSGGKT